MTDEPEEIICHTTPWYKKRRLLMVAMLLGFSAYFFYDWKVGYPEKRAKFGAYWPVYEQTVLQEKNSARWDELAKQNQWPAKPDSKYKDWDWDYKLKEQFIWSIGTGLLGLGLLGAYLRNKSRVLRADADSLTTPEGVRIPFASVTKIDKRKWDNKALAYLWWTDGGTTRKAVIDDLVFDGAGKVLDRLMAQFHGELIDLEREPSPPADSSREAPPSTPAPS
jgi:hypothetical protein